MKAIFSGMGAVALSLLAVGGTASTMSAGEESVDLESVELKDQFEAPFRYTFPDSRPMVLLAADKKGYPGLTPWIDAMRARSQGEVTIVGVADMRAVPRFLRGTVRHKFAAAEKHPVLLDWDGTVLGPLHPLKKVPNAYLITPEGRVFFHLSGEATATKLEIFQRQLDALLTTNDLEQATEQVVRGVH